MNIKVQGLHTTLTPDLIAYTEKRFMSLSKFINNADATCVVELTMETKHHSSGNICKAEASIDPNGDMVYAVTENTNFEQAIDELRDEMERILSSRKERKITLFRRGSQKIKAMIKGIIPRK